MASTFERDEFDDIAEQGGPLGVHRAPRAWWTRALPVLVAFVLAGAAAYGLATYYWGPGSANAPVAETSPGTSPQPTTSPAESPAPEPESSPEPEPEPDPEPVINFDTDITVLNAAGIGGLAATNQEKLEDDGFTSVAASNLTSNLPDQNTVIYSSDDDAETAARVAEVLGIDDVEQGSPPGGASIEVILVSDPDA